MLAYFASRDLIPLYSVYSLLFTDSGLSVAQVSSLFVIWSLTAFVLEVPSGAWADTIDRRLLLVLSALVHAAGFASWVLLPTYTGFALGFVLWGVAGSIMSGTFESLVYDELDAHGQAGRYAADHRSRLRGCHGRQPGRRRLGGPAAAGRWLPAGRLGRRSGSASSSSRWPRRCRSPRSTPPSGTTVCRGGAVHDAAVETERVAVRYVAMLRSGVREASHTVVVRRMVLIYAAVIGASAYDEYFPLVADGHGVATETIPWLIGLVVTGQVIGTALAGRTARMSGGDDAGGCCSSRRC